MCCKLYFYCRNTYFVIITSAKITVNSPDKTNHSCASFSLTLAGEGLRLLHDGPGNLRLFTDTPMSSNQQSPRSLDGLVIPTWG